MSRVLPILAISGLFAVLLATAADARLPRGAVLSANAQEADPTTGATEARGNAEIAIEAFGILGRADAIELRPASDEIQFKGGAMLEVGDERYQGDAITCDLAFSRCTAVSSDQAPPASQTLPAVSASGIATTNP
jgi:hypothetical protein